MTTDLCTMSSDARILPLACLLESNIQVDNFPVSIILFDDISPLTAEIAEVYGAKIINPKSRWDEIGKRIFGREEYRKGIPCWKYFRKLNAFDGCDCDHIFLDGNIIIINSLKPAIDALKSHDLLFGGRSNYGRNFPAWSTKLLGIMDPHLGNGFNASFWVARRSLFNDLDDDAIAPGVRKMLGKAPEQSFMQLAALFLGKRMGALGEIDGTLLPTLWAETAPRFAARIMRANVTPDGRTPLTVKWSGAAFHDRRKVRHSSRHAQLLENILAKINGDLRKNIISQYENISN